VSTNANTGENSIAEIHSTDKIARATSVCNTQLIKHVTYHTGLVFDKHKLGIGIWCNIDGFENKVDIECKTNYVVESNQKSKSILTPSTTNFCQFNRLSLFLFPWTQSIYIAFKWLPHSMENAQHYLR
jgi:hypothetical protein